MIFTEIQMAKFRNRFFKAFDERLPKEQPLTKCMAMNLIRNRLAKKYDINNEKNEDEKVSTNNN